jgi:hypothetical protein
LQPDAWTRLPGNAQGPLPTHRFHRLTGGPGESGIDGAPIIVFRHEEGRSLGGEICAGRQKAKVVFPYFSSHAQGIQSGYALAHTILRAIGIGGNSSGKKGKEGEKGEEAMSFHKAGLFFDPFFQRFVIQRRGSPVQIGKKRIQVALNPVVDGHFDIDRFDPDRFNLQTNTSARKRQKRKAD